MEEGSNGTGGAKGHILRKERSTYKDTAVWKAIKFGELEAVQRAG